MENRILKYIQTHAMLHPGDRVSVALSGGADSVCLLHILMALAPILKISVSAVHVHHGIRDTADRDEQFVKKVCSQYGILLQSIHVNVPERVEIHHESVEEAARKLRYAAFERLDADVIALAHHSQDQAETLLLNLLRGSGLRGLAGMLPVHGRYIRPLLNERPETIRGWLQDHRYLWMEDETNQDTKYRRNHLRHVEIPNLTAAFNPKLVETLASTAGLLQEDEEALMTWAQRAYEDCRNEKGLSIAKLQLQPKAIRARCFRLYLQETIGISDITQKHLQDLELLLQMQSGRKTVLAGGHSVVREYDNLYMDSVNKNKEENGGEWPVYTVPGQVRITPFERNFMFSFVENMENDTFFEKLYTKCFDYDTIKNTLVIRTRRSGDYLTMAGGRKKLKEYMIDNKIPASERDSVLLLADGSHILWVIGYRMSDACKIGPQTTKILQVQVCSSTYEGTEIHHD